MSERPSPVHPALPHPGAPVDAHHRPFVGNRTVGDNMCESAQIAAWTALGAASGKMRFAMVADCVQVGGQVRSREDRDAALRAIAMAIAPVHLIDDLSIAASPAHESAPQNVLGAPILRVRRFCSLSDPSLSAAVTSAIERLDALFAALNVAWPAQVAMIYRNRGETTVTIDVGAMVAASVEKPPCDHDLVEDNMPAGPDISVFAQGDIAGLLQAQASLLGQAHGIEHDAVWWQVFDTSQLRPWHGLPAAPLHLALASIELGDVSEADIEALG